MNQRTLFVDIRKDQISKVEALLKVLKYTVSKINLQNINFYEFKDKTVLSFSINDDYYSSVLERFALNKIEVVVNDDKSKKIIEDAGEKLKKKNTVVSINWGSDAKAKKKKKAKSIEMLMEDGNYEELIRISRDVRVEKARTELAKSAIEPALKKSIQNLYFTGKNDKYKTEHCFGKLLNIASNSYLRMNNKNKFMREAGLLAINLASDDSEFYQLLIKMGNKSNLMPELSIKAILQFYSLVLSKKSPNSKHVQIAAKQINEQYLKNLYDDYKDKFTKEEKLGFAKFVNFMKSARGKQ